jgi:hypothetical protein
MSSAIELLTFPETVSNALGTNDDGSAGKLKLRVRVTFWK